jgi:hypothetical protein
MALPRTHVLLLNEPNRASPARDFYTKNTGVLKTKYGLNFYRVEMVSSHTGDFPAGEELIMMYSMEDIGYYMHLKFRGIEAEVIKRFAADKRLKVRLVIVNLGGHVAHLSPDKIDHVKGLVTYIGLREIKDCILYETLKQENSLEEYFKIVAKEQSSVGQAPAPESNDYDLLMAYSLLTTPNGT